MTLHPQSQAFIRGIAEKSGPGWHEMPVGQSRQLFDSLTTVFGEGPAVPCVKDYAVDGLPKMRIYRPTDSRNVPTIIFFHGGGWVLGNIESHDTVCRNLANATAFNVISVDYRLAPEHKYPAALDDAYEATKHIAENANDLRVDPNKLVVAGDSAGGNLAAALCLKIRDTGGPNIAKQVLIYPVIEPDFMTESYLSCAEGHGLTRTTMQWFWDQYITGGDADRTYACLANADVSDLPPAFVLTAEYDILRDEGEAYAARLGEAGVPVVRKQYPGMLHGFVHFAGVFDDAIPAIHAIAEYLEDLKP